IGGQCSCDVTIIACSLTANNAILTRGDDQKAWSEIGNCQNRVIGQLKSDDIPMIRWPDDPITRSFSNPSPSPARLIPMTALERQHRFRVALCFALVYVFWGSTYLAIRVAVQHVPPFAVGSVRYLASGLLMLLWCAFTGKKIWI